MPRILKSDRHRLGVKSRWRSARLALCVGLVYSPLGTIAQTPAVDPPPPVTPPDHPSSDAVGPSPAEELMLFDEIPVVVTGSRVAQSIRATSVPITVISSDDLKYGGFFNVSEALGLVPGMDVLRLSRSTYALGVRGLHSEYADRTLLLIDGRSANSPSFGGIQFNRLPLIIDDIDRIEVVRGPGGAAWGANAFNGVINVITKDPAKTRGLMLGSQVSWHGDTYNQFRYGFGDDRLSMRLSLGYDQQTKTVDAVGDNQSAHNDFSRRRLIDLQGAYSVGDQARLRFGIGYDNLTFGSEEFLNSVPDQNNNFYTIRPYLKFEHDIDADTSWYIRWFANIDREDRPGRWNTQTVENDLEAQYNFKLDRHALSLGGNLRLVTVDVGDNPPPEGSNQPTSDLETWLGAFVIDRYQVSDRLALEGQFRFDYYSETNADWSGRASILYDLDSGHAHTLRLSAAKAFRAPAVNLRQYEQVAVALPSPPLPPDLYGYNLLYNDKFHNEETWSLEAGVNSDWGGGFTTAVNTYYQRYESLIGARSIDDPLGVGREFYRLENMDGGTAYGVELEAAYHASWGKLSAWYAVNQFSEDEGRQSIRALEPAPYKFGASVRWFVDRDWTFNSNLRFTSITPSDPIGSFDDDSDQTYALDLSLSRRIFNGRGELTFGVLDVLDQLDRPTVQPGNLSSSETVGTTIFAAVRLNF